MLIKLGHYFVNVDQISTIRLETLEQKEATSGGKIIPQAIVRIVGFGEPITVLDCDELDQLRSFILQAAATKEASRSFNLLFADRSKNWTRCVDELIEMQRAGMLQEFERANRADDERLELMRQSNELLKKQNQLLQDMGKLGLVMV